MSAQADMNKLLGSITGGVGTAINLGKKFSEEDGIDLKMSKKAKNNLNQKIKAVKQNKNSHIKRRAKLDIGGEE